MGCLACRPDGSPSHPRLLATLPLRPSPPEAEYALVLEAVMRARLADAYPAVTEVRARAGLHCEP
jgi:hypothetical protein